MEIELVKSAAKGDQRAWNRLVKHLQPKLRRWFEARFNRLDPLDLIQDTLVGISSKLPSYKVRHEAAFMTWVFRIANYKALNALRKQGNKIVVAWEDDQAAPGTGLSTQLDRAQRKEMARAAIGDLPKSQRMAALNMLEGGDTDALAEMAGIQKASARRQENRVLERLCSLLGPVGTQI